MTNEMYEDLLERNKLQISELNTLTEEQDRHIVELEKEKCELLGTIQGKDEVIANLKEQNKDLCESLDIMNNRESELLEQIEELKSHCKAEKSYVEYRNINCKITRNSKNKHLHKDWRESGVDRHKAYIAGYLNGLAEGRKEKWHKVSDGDYPPCERGNCSINVLTDRGDIVYYNYDDESWIAEPSSVEIDPPKAWCEIPRFEEE